MKLYNTLTRKKEKLKTIEDDFLKIYVCGVTIYDDVHLGHALSYTYYDILINYLKHFLDYEILYVRNITDVGHLTNDNDNGEDKIEKRAKERKIHPAELVYKYSQRMWEFFDKLLLTRPNIEPYASAHIIEMQDWIKQILENGFAYEVNGNVYYDVSKFKDYYKFSNRNSKELEENTRFENDPNKKNPADFALWIKADPNHIMQWNSPWGKGYPGWHLECSVMSTKYLGKHFDIHGGGIEHLFPHHSNEIAQNYAYYKHKVVNYWVHTSMLNINGKKMGKSLGNFITVEDFLKEHSAQAFRLLVSLGHYRKPQNYTTASIDDAEKTLKKLNYFILRLQNTTEGIKDNKIIDEILENTKENFKKSMNDDLNTPQAWSSIFFLVKEINKLLDKDKISKNKAQEILSFLSKINSVFKVFNFKNNNSENKTKIKKEEIEKLINERNKYREEKKYEKADLIRLNLKNKGVILSDEGSKTTWYWE
jgi:cysteinyl-tRNA synthetase